MSARFWLLVVLTIAGCANQPEPTGSSPAVTSATPSQPGGSGGGAGGGGMGGGGMGGGGMGAGGSSGY